MCSTDITNLKMLFNFWINETIFRKSNFCCVFDYWFTLDVQIKIARCCIMNSNLKSGKQKGFNSLTHLAHPLGCHIPVFFLLFFVWFSFNMSEVYCARLQKKKLEIFFLKIFGRKKAKTEDLEFFLHLVELCAPKNAG